jgi:hypothetical protein
MNAIMHEWKNQKIDLNGKTWECSNKCIILNMLVILTFSQFTLTHLYFEYSNIHAIMHSRIHALSIVAL